MPLLRFAVEVQLIRYHDYYFCFHRRTQMRVIIAVRLKDIIDLCRWSQCSPEDQEEIRSLRELGFLIETPMQTSEFSGANLSHYPGGNLPQTSVDSPSVSAEAIMPNSEDDSSLERG